MHSFSLPKHELEFRADHLYSLTFDDVFHSTSGALEQAQHVFIQSNHLPARFGSEHLCIAELGFGSGINFLATWIEWKKSGANHPLLYTSIEGYPIRVEEIQKYLQFISVEKSDQLGIDKNEIKEFINELAEQYPKLVRGFHNIKLDNSRVTLNLIFHPVKFALKNLSHKFDAWFIDGFSPKKNEEMWSEEVMDLVFKNTKDGGTFATYSTSARIKENSLRSGFKIEKRLGFSRKREMLVGIKNDIQPTIFPKAKTVAIIGGGLAGATLAYSLSKRGAQISLFEKQDKLFTGASGNERGVIMPQLSSKPDAQCRFFLSGFLHTVRTLSTLNKKEPFESLNQGGVIRYCNVAKWQSVYNKFEDLGFDILAKRLDEQEIKALLFYDGSAISPSEFGERLLKEAGDIDIHLNSQVTELDHSQDSITLTVNNIQQKFDAVVFACAYGSAFIEHLSWIPIEKIKGELGIIKTPKGLTNQVMCYDGYVVPLPHNKSLIGATYEHNAHDETPSYTTSNDLYKRLQNYQDLPDLKEEDYESGRVCFRTTSPDRLPIVGPIEPSSNIYVSLGHGSRGLVSTPLSAELISQMIFNEPLSMENDLTEEVLPIRYRLRSIRRNKLIEDIYPASFLWRET